MAKVLGIGGVFQKADNPGQMYEWYERYLALKRQPDGSGVILPWLQAGGTGKEGMTVWSIFKRDSKYFGPGNQTFMINYIVDDLDGILDGLRKGGATVDDRVEDYTYGRFGWATDPEGNRLELWQPPEQTAASPG
jgi:hypothetical protein